MHLMHPNATTYCQPLIPLITGPLCSRPHPSCSLKLTFKVLVARERLTNTTIYSALHFWLLLHLHLCSNNYTTHEGKDSIYYVHTKTDIVTFECRPSNSPVLAGVTHFSCLSPTHPQCTQNLPHNTIPAVLAPSSAY